MKLVILSGILGLSHTAQSQTYHAVDLGVATSNQGGFPKGLNSAGVYAISNSQFGVPFATINENANGTFAGTTADYDSFAGNSNGITNLAGIVGAYSQIWALNDQGTMVGYSEPEIYDPHSRAFVIENGAVTYLPSLGGGFGGAQGVSQNNLVVGHSWLANGAIDGFLWDGSAIIDIGSLGGSKYFSNTNRLFQSDAWGVNNLGEVVGDSYTPDGEQRGVYYSNGRLADIGVLSGGNASSLDAINDSGLAVGQSNLGTGQTHGIAYKNGALSDVNSFTTGLISGSYLASCLQVNDSGQILATDQRGELYVLNPQAVPEPNSPTTICVGACTLMLLKRRAASASAYSCCLL